MEKIKFIRVLRNGKSLLRFKLQETPAKYNTLKGEVDIIIESASDKTPFQKACVQTAFGHRCMQETVRYASWHGFYAAQGESIKFPVINFHNGSQKIEHRHTGTINQNDVFLFPICSVYLPKNIEAGLQKSVFPKDITAIFELNNGSNARVDFFVLPKSVKFADFMRNYTHSIFLAVADISIFDKSLNGMFQPLPIKPELRFYTVGDWDIVIRVIYAGCFKETDMNPYYSILFQDPNDALEMLLRRRIAYPNDDGTLSWSSFQERYDKEKMDRVNENEEAKVNTYQRSNA